MRSCALILMVSGSAMLAVIVGGGLAQQAEAQGNAEIRGTVKFSGTAPKPDAIKMNADPQCQLQHQEPATSQQIVVNPNGTLKYVFVYVKEGLGEPAVAAPNESLKLDQHGCMYEPHVFGIQVNQPLEIVNSDATLHNVNCKPTKSKPFNLAQPVKGMKTSKSFSAPEIMVKCVCNVHPWMAAYIGVVGHPFFATTGDEGSFALSGLPAGQYTVEAWHETFGTQTQTVTVAAGETASVDFEFK